MPHNRQPYRHGKENEQNVEITSSTATGTTKLENTADLTIDPATETTLQTLADALASQANDSLLINSESALDVSAVTVPTEQQTPVGVEDSGGVQIDPATETTLTNIAAALVSNGTDTLQTEQQSPVSVEDSGGVQIDPATETTLTNIAAALASNGTDTLQTEQQTPVGVEDSTGTQVDPAQNVDGASASAAASGTGSSNAATISVPDGCRTFTVAYDTSGAATITVEVSPDGGTTWYPYTTYSPGSAQSNADTLETGFDGVRAYIDANLNSLHVGAKGA